MENSKKAAPRRSRSTVKAIADVAPLSDLHQHILNSSTRPKTPLRAQQRKHTRAKIVSAAIVEFKEKRFHYATVDDISSRANVSRATFYTHFRGKEEVLLEIIIQKHSTKHLSFVPLVEAETVDENFLYNWLKNTFVARFLEDREWLFSYYVVCDLYSHMANFFSGGRDEVIDLLGLRFGAFRARGEDGEADAAKRARGHLELYKMEQFGLHVVYPGLSVPVDVFARETARSLLAFLQSDAIGPPICSNDRSQADD
jgi:AcrR family transcriptional regulator